MNPAAIILSSLTATSLLLSVALALAWRSFGRERHAAIWSIAFGLSAGTWVANLIAIDLPARKLPFTLLAMLASVCCFALIAHGFRRRAGLPARFDAMIPIGGVAVLAAWWGIAFSTNTGASRAVICLFCAAMLIVSAMSLRGERPNGRRATNAPFWMLTCFAGYTLALAAVAFFVTDARSTTGIVYNILLLIGLPTGLFGVGLFAMFLLAADLAEGMRQLAASDPLTGILNRRGFEQAAGLLVAQGLRQGRPLAIVIADLDHFKTINDRFGHGVGDAVLQCFVEHVGSTIRQGDLFGRLGGEEFVLMLPDTNGSHAIEAVERVRGGLAAAIEGLVPHAGISASFGIALLDRRGGTLTDALQRADQALYQSKLNGRDRITLADVPSTNAWVAVPRKVA